MKASFILKVVDAYISYTIWLQLKKNFLFILKARRIGILRRISWLLIPLVFVVYFILVVSIAQAILWLMKCDKEEQKSSFSDRYLRKYNYLPKLRCLKVIDPFYQIVIIPTILERIFVRRCLEYHQCACRSIFEIYFNYFHILDLNLSAPYLLISLPTFSW